MIYHELDLFILDDILGKKDTTTWKIAKEFKWEDKPLKFKEKQNFDDFLNKKDKLVRERLKCMAKEGLIKIVRNGGKNIYEVDISKVVKKSCNFYFIILNALSSEVMMITQPTNW